MQVTTRATSAAEVAGSDRAIGLRSAVQLTAFVDLAHRVGPILVFLMAITVVAELADGIGLFAIDRPLGRRRWGGARFSGCGCWSWWWPRSPTAVLSLDTTAVLLTPVVLVLARRLRLSQELFAFTAVWLANTASLILPVSNLTNLLADARLRPAGVAFSSLMWAPALAIWVVTVILLAVVFRRRLPRSLRGAPAVPGRGSGAANDRGAGVRRPGAGVRLRGERHRRRRGRRSRPGGRLPAAAPTAGRLATAAVGAGARRKGPVRPGRDRSRVRTHFPGERPGRSRHRLDRPPSTRRGVGRGRQPAQQPALLTWRSSRLRWTLPSGWLRCWWA